VYESPQAGRENRRAPDPKRGLMLAKVCTVCPLCIARRRWPETSYARLMKRLERWCPFCQAYERRRRAADPARAARAPTEPR